MRVIALTPYPELIAKTFALAGDEMVPADELTADTKADFVVSYGHRKLIKEPALTAFAGRIINIHISMLPFNRGADPNFWACFDQTPSGVSIHHIDAGMDTGDLIGQRSVFFREYDTLQSSYNRLRNSAEEMFDDLWPALRRDACPSWKQPAGGSVHKAADKTPYFSQLVKGWHTTLVEATDFFADCAAGRTFWNKYDSEIEQIRSLSR